MRFHDLRHSCATLLIAQGVHLSVIKDILGHTQISTTANAYGHVLPDLQRAATVKLDDVLGPQAPKPGESIGESLRKSQASEDAKQDANRDATGDGSEDDGGDGDAEATDGDG